MKKSTLFETPPRVRLLALPESSSAVLYGFHEVFSTFSDAWSGIVDDDPLDAPFDVLIAAEERGIVRCAGGAPVEAHATMGEIKEADFVVVTDLAIDPRQDHRRRWQQAVDWLNRLHARGATICSVCSGSVLLAAAGLLEHRPATTHWAFVGQFRTFFPNVDLQPHRILLPTGRNSDIVTAGGMAAWEDLALYLIARCYGEAVAIRAAKLFLFGDRSEGQLLYAARLKPKRHDDAVIGAIQSWVAEHYACENCVARMVDRSGLPERTFKRRFKASTGYTPIEYVQSMRIEEARQMLESGDESIDRIAELVGYQDSSSFHRLFKRSVGVTPGKYRQRFRGITRTPR